MSEKMKWIAAVACSIVLWIVLIGGCVLVGPKFFVILAGVAIASITLGITAYAVKCIIDGIEAWREDAENERTV